MPEDRISFFYPDENTCDLTQTTDLCIAAHPDDIELMAYPAIYACLRQPGRHFVGLVLTDGAGPAAGEMLKDCTPAKRAEIRKEEQYQAARLGGYLAVSMLGHSSDRLRTQAVEIVDQVAEVLRLCRPERVYIHNLADKHDTHVAAAMTVITALRALPEATRPQKVYGMEVWRSLDWVCDGAKTVFNAYGDPALERELITVFRSQIADHKRYDDGVLGRRAANAVFLSGYEKDRATGACYGLDMTEDIFNYTPLPEVIGRQIDDFKADVIGRLERLSASKTSL